MSTPPITSETVSPSTVEPLAAALLPVRRFTVDQYHRMIETGILGENDRVELVNGWIVEMSPIGPPHMTSVSLIFAALQERLPAGWIVRVQGPVTLQTGEPEPDLVVARGSLRDYRDRHPGVSDIGMVIEVADASLQFDRVQKRMQYATAGIPVYWIVNLINRCVEVRRIPVGGDYSIQEVFGADGLVDLTLDGMDIGKFSIAEFLP
jgi:Uma2 family endonuclease